MKTILTLFLLAVTASLYGQKKDSSNIYSSSSDIAIRLLSEQTDTIPTILLCADTAKIVTIRVVNGANTFFDGYSVAISPQTTTFPVVGYRVAGNVQYYINASKHLIDGQQYLDHNKQPLPKSFIVFGFVDRKQ